MAENEKVEGVVLAKVDEKTIDRFVVEFGLKLKAKATLAEKVRTLARHLKIKTPDSQLADCDVCGGDSDVRLSRCPYCGVGDDEEVKPSTKKEEPVTKKKPAASRKEAAAKKKIPVKSPEGRKKKKTPKKSPKAIEKPKVEGPPVGKTEKDLDTSVTKVHSLRAAGAVCIWELGAEIGRIFDNRLHMLRKTKDGHSRYKNWGQFVQLELSMSPSQSYKLMDVAKLFSKQDVQDVGNHKLGFMIQLPEKERKELLEKARSGMTSREVHGEVKRLRAGKEPRKTGRSSQTEAATKVGPKKRAKPANEITVATQLGRVTIPLYARPKSKKEREDPRRATTISHDPFGKEVLTSSVVVYYRLVKQAKGLALVVERRREESSK